MKILLDEYIYLANRYDGEHFVNDKDWHYIMSNLNNNINLVKKLVDKSLLLNHTNICDAGIGLGSALFDIYLQTSEIENKTFNFFGIEKNKKYIDYLNENLLRFWNNKLVVINQDLTIHNFSNYDIIYTFLPYKDYNLLEKLYKRITSQIKSGSIIIENSDSGRNRLSKIKELEEINLDTISVFRKY